MNKLNSAKFEVREKGTAAFRRYWHFQLFLQLVRDGYVREGLKLVDLGKFSFRSYSNSCGVQTESAVKRQPQSGMVSVAGVVEINNVRIHSLN